MESSYRGLSGMDAARAVIGQGWPFAGAAEVGPRSGDGAREPRRSRGRMPGQALLVTFWGDCQK
ncbi:hypothetical protein BZL42_06545 [Pseudomonas indica]|nr:hypothetical protein BZL42_06545 [Pseudomonas indica]